MGKPRVKQNHHLAYQPEIVGKLWKGEHEILSKINLYTRKNVSLWFVQCLKVWIALNENRATELDKSKSPTVLDMK